MTVPETFAPGTIVVTGAGSGIGRALVLALAAEAGRTIVVADRDLATAQETARLAGSTAIAFQCDVTSASDIERLARQHEPIAAWFSNAGIHTSDGLGDPGEWQSGLDVNLLAHVRAANAVLPAMEKRGSGAFVITASAAGLLMDLRTAVYTACKHAAVSLAEWMAVCAADGISVHCVCPEGVRTGMTKASSEFSAAGITFVSAEEVADAIIAGIRRGDFMIYTHEGTAEFERRRVNDRARWLSGMRRAREKSLQLNRIFSIPERTSI